MYYKVVEYNMESAFVGSHLFKLADKKLSVHYKINDWTIPNFPGSKLMVFSDIEYAKNFKYILGWGNHIYTCEVKNPNKKGMFLRADLNLPRIFFKTLALKNKKKKFSHLLRDPIEGTIFCDAVKLIERIA